MTNKPSQQQPEGEKVLNALEREELCMPPEPSHPTAVTEKEKTTIFGVVKTGWETYELEGLYATKEMAARALAHYVSEENKDVDERYGTGSEYYAENPERCKEMHIDHSFKYDAKFDQWRNCLDNIRICEFEVKGLAAARREQGGEKSLERTQVEYYENKIEEKNLCQFNEDQIAEKNKRISELEKQLAAK